MQFIGEGGWGANVDREDMKDLSDMQQEYKLCRIGEAVRERTCRKWGWVASWKEVDGRWVVGPYGGLSLGTRSGKRYHVWRKMVRVGPRLWPTSVEVRMKGNGRL